MHEVHEVHEVHRSELQVRLHFGAEFVVCFGEAPGFLGFRQGAPRKLPSMTWEVRSPELPSDGADAQRAGASAPCQMGLDGLRWA